MGDTLNRSTLSLLTFSIQNSISSISVGYQCTLFLANSQVYNSGGCLGVNTMNPTASFDLNGSNNFISNGFYHTLVITNTSDLYGFGQNSVIIMRFTIGYNWHWRPNRSVCSNKIINFEFKICVWWILSYTCTNDEWSSVVVWW
jgi:hypothetical protein